MCVAIPARVIEIIPGSLPMARVEQAGQELQCCIAYLPQLEVGEFVLIQHGFAVEQLDAEAAAISLVAFQELGLLDQVAETPAL